MNHHLAAGLYCLCIGFHDPNWLENLRVMIARETQAGNAYKTPKIEDIIVLTEFEALNRFLAERCKDVGVLQGEVDALVKKAAG